MIDRIILDRSKDRSHLFVFPSEVAADFWRRRLLTLGPRGAVENDRFQSWDSFKERFLTGSSDRKPVNKLSRLLFAASVREQNPAELASILPAESGSLSHIASILPELPRLRSSAGYGELPRETVSAYERLYESYRAFLESRGLFEPSWRKPEARGIPSSVSLFFPELLEDYREYGELLASLESVTIHGIEVLSPPARRRREEYNHVITELRALMLRLDELLEEGVLPGDIAVTVASFDSLRGELRSKARAYGVPIRERAGAPLTELAGGRFFPLLEELYDSAFHPDALASLLLDGALPWKEPALSRRLVSRGREGRCVASTRSTARKRWLQVVRREEGLPSLFKRLATLSEQIVESKSFGELQRRLYEFIGALFDDERWDPDALSVFQRGTLLAAQLVGTESALSLSVPSPWSLFLTLLREEIYVTQEPREGIPIYPYRVSAGIRPEHHLILNATNSDTRVSREPLSFLREDLRERFDAEPVDLSEPFLRAYVSSGEEITVSHSSVNNSGAQIPAAFFMSRREELPPVEPAEEDRLFRRDPYLRELSYFRGEGTVAEVGKLYRRQRLGSARIAAQRRDKRQVDYRTTVIDSETLRGKLLGEDGRITLSHTGVQSYFASPFGYLLQRLLRLEELELDPQEVSPMSVGSFYHDVLKGVNVALRDRGIEVNEETKETVFELLAQEVTRQGAEYDRKEFSLPAPAMAHVQRRAAPLIRRALEAEISALPPYRVSEVELSFEEEIAPGVAITGRIDRLGVTEEGGYTILDYKKGVLPKPKELIPGEGGGESVTTLQLPIYLLATESKLGRSIARSEELYYLSVEQGELRFLRSDSGGGGRGALSGEKLQRFVDESRDRLIDIAEAIRRGDFRCGEKDPDCDGCPFRGVCRSKFSVRDRYE